MVLLLLSDHIALVCIARGVSWYFHATISPLLTVKLFVLVTRLWHNAGLPAAQYGRCC